MPRGGKRRGVGRPPSELSQRVREAPGSLEHKLTFVAEDESAPLDVRLDATRRLFGLLAGKKFSTLESSVLSL